MKLSLMLPAKPDIKWQLAKQIGVKYAMTKLHPDLTGALPPYDLDTLAAFKARFNKAGFFLAGLESDEFDMSRIKYGKDGRDQDIEKYCLMIRNCGELGIPMICYNFMPTGWYRTSTDIKERGGAFTSGFDYDTAKKDPIRADRLYSDEEMWENFTYFIQTVMPTAEKAGVKMALHPDDPPVPALHGVARIFINAEAVRRALDLVPGAFNGIAFCQATFKAMGENVKSLINEFGKQHKIFFVHLRDIKGNREKFQETFHDNGPTDMAALLRHLEDSGFNGPIRPDHTPGMAGESNENPGYEMQGRLYAIGYMRGLMEAAGIHFE